MKKPSENKVMRITSAPNGQAPLHIREKWIGVEIPYIEIGTPNAVGVVDHMPVKQYEAFTVNQTDALMALRKKSPEAADWWKDMGFPVPGAYFTFNLKCAEVI